MMKHRPQGPIANPSTGIVQRFPKFRDVTLRPFAKGHVVCGQVNAKNSYGAYVGFVPFVAGVSAVTITKGSGGVMDDLAETTILVGCS